LFKTVSSRIPLCVTQKATALYFTANAWSKVGFRGFHSQQKTVEHLDMKVRILPALSDNYMYLLVDQSSNQAAVVDPVDPDSVLAAVEEEGVNLTTVLTTHHHWDHAGGNKDLVSRMSDLCVVGGDDRIDCLTKKVQQGDTVTVGTLSVNCISTPCHTTGHICYYVTSDQDKLVFTGDTLFLGGCGRFFEGTADQMYSALVTKLGNLPGDTKVYCGHEYSLQNLAFGHHVEPDNKDITAKIEWSKSQRELETPLPTVPSTIEEEKSINPFMRVEDPILQSYTGETDPILVMKTLRAEKDNFKSK